MRIVAHAKQLTSTSLLCDWGRPPPPLSPLLGALSALHREPITLFAKIVPPV